LEKDGRRFDLRKALQEMLIRPAPKDKGLGLSEGKSLLHASRAACPVAVMEVETLAL
jgi:hypothetical protein